MRTEGAASSYAARNFQLRDPGATEAAPYVRFHRGATEVARYVRILRALTLVAAIGLSSACRQDMHDQPKYEPLETSDFFTDGRASRPQVPGTVARGHLDEDEAMFTGKSGHVVLADLPIPVTRELLARGRERYDIYCSPCHDRLGTGEGMIVRRGYRQPPSFHIDRLREAPAGHFFDVSTNGFGAMPDYRAQTSAHDRWAIVAYIRALQLSQNATLADVPERDRPNIGRRPAASHGPSGPTELAPERRKR